MWWTVYITFLNFVGFTSWSDDCILCGSDVFYVFVERLYISNKCVYVHGNDEKTDFSLRSYRLWKHNLWDRKPLESTSYTCLIQYTSCCSAFKCISLIFSACYPFFIRFVGHSLETWHCVGSILATFQNLLFPNDQDRQCLKPASRTLWNSRELLFKYM